MFDTDTKRRSLRNELELLTKMIQTQRQSMLHVKQNPYDSRIVMEHITTISANTDHVLTVLQNLIEELVKESERNDWAAK